MIQNLFGYVVVEKAFQPNKLKKLFATFETAVES